MKSAHPMDSKTSSLSLEAAEWLLNLEDSKPDEEHPYLDPKQRQEAFLQWLTRSPEHLQVFLETAETWHRLTLIDSKHLIQIQELLEDREAEVIHLYEPERDADRIQTLATWSRPRLKWRLRGVAALLAAIAVVMGLLVRENIGARDYTTAVGEQRTWQLDDGSVVYLNADSRVRVDISKRFRHIELTRGEALFVVEHAAQRPFVVRAGEAVIRAVGTQFNVRQRMQGTDVVVVEGAVQVAATNTREADLHSNSTPEFHAQIESGPVRLGAGEKAHVNHGAVRKAPNPSVDEALSWRERRLVFRDAPLAEIAAEFNRYNHRQIYIEGDNARAKQMTGVFDADRPESLIFYTSKDETLLVRPEGNDWVIQER